MNLPTTTAIELHVPPDRRGCYGWVEKYFPRIESALLRYKGAGELLSLVAKRQSPHVLRVVARHRDALDEDALRELLLTALAGSADSWDRSLR